MLFAVVVDLVNRREPLEKREALVGVVGDLVDDLASPVGDAIDLNDVMAVGDVARKGVTHEQRDGTGRVSLLEQLGEVFSRMLSPREK